MPRLKYYNETTQQWEYVIVGGQGPQGETGPGVAAGGTAGQIIAKIDGTDFNTEWIDNYTEQVKHTVKAGESLTKGQAVYVSSANGTNMIVSKASNSGESTSSKTMGLIAQTLANNDQGFVITEGLLAGLNTASATAGDPVWLGTSGNILYGLSNKPTAPAHLVFIGIVTRVHATQGEIFIKVQNGFELNELHDVSITSPTAGDIVARNSANTLWENMTLAEAGVSTVGHTHDDRYYTETETDTAISNAIAGLVDTAPATLDTLNELAAAINDDASFASTVTTALGTKSDTGHTHDDRYYTETETDTLLNAKANISGTTFTASTSASTPLKVKAAASQTADMQQWQDSSGTSKIRINSGGKVYIDTASDFAMVGDNNGTGGIEIKSTTGTAASMSFHVPNVLATNIGIDATNAKFSIGGWSIPSTSLTIDGSGRVSTPYQPSVHANSGTKNGSGIFTNYSTADGGIGFRYRNVGGHFNVTSGRFTAPVSGRYLITALYISSSGVVERNIGWLYINGTNIGEWTEAYGQYDDQSATSVFYLNANDYVEVATHTGIPFDGVVTTIDFLG